MIDALKDKKGKVHFNPGNQVQAILEFLKDLYQSTNLNVEEIRNFLATPEIVKKLTPEHREFMDSPISAQEILDEIKRIHPNKARGPDGFPIEFFKKFATELSPALERTFNFVRSTGQIPDSWKQVNIVTIPKPNKDVSLPSSYRPIAVLNKDYKIFTGVLVCRLNKIVQFYVEEDQTGFIAHRNISDNIRWVLNVIHFCKSRKVDSVALALDFKKAFDSVEFMYIHKLLEVMDFGPEFLSIINSIYGQSTTRLKVNFRFSDDFHINRGTWQGCPLSPLLFALAVEPLANYIRNNEQIQGVRIFHRTHTISLFADDVVLFLTNPMSSIKALLSVLDLFF